MLHIMLEGFYIKYINPIILVAVVSVDYPMVEEDVFRERLEIKHRILLMVKVVSDQIKVMVCIVIVNLLVVWDLEIEVI